MMKMAAGDHCHHWSLGLLETYKSSLSVVHMQIAVNLQLVLFAFVWRGWDNNIHGHVINFNKLNIEMICGLNHQKG